MAAALNAGTEENWRPAKTQPGLGFDGSCFVRHTILTTASENIHVISPTIIKIAGKIFKRNIRYRRLDP